MFYCPPIIRHLLFTLLFFSSLGGVTLAVQAKSVLPEPAQNTHPVILVLGDSLSAAHGMAAEQGWIALLKQNLAKQFNQPSYAIINASISGETSGGGLARLEPALKHYQPKIVIVELGANDGLRGFPIKVLKQNLHAIIELCKQYQAEVLLVGVQIPFNYGSRYTDLFEQVFADLAQQHQLSLLPSLLGDIPLKPELMQADRLHPNAKAQPLILERVYPLIKPLVNKHTQTKQK